jgi:hypothetical protein
MPDLSRILEDVYSPPAGEVEVASEAALDKAFADWVPSLADDATSTERSLFSMAYDEPTVEPARPTLEWLTTEVATDTLETPAPALANLTDLASFAGEAPAQPEPSPAPPAPSREPLQAGRGWQDEVPAPEPDVVAEAPTGPATWRRDSDNILPGRRGNFRLLRR